VIRVDGQGFHTCAHCSQRIGAYEPLRWRRPDGVVTTSSLLRVREDPEFGGATAELYHRDCFDDAHGASPD
jgi:hypothetical protein